MRTAEAGEPISLRRRLGRSVARSVVQNGIGLATLLALVAGPAIHSLDGEWLGSSEFAVRTGMVLSLWPPIAMPLVVNAWQSEPGGDRFVVFPARPESSRAGALVRALATVVGCLVALAIFRALPWSSAPG